MRTTGWSGSGATRSDTPSATNPDDLPDGPLLPRLRDAVLIALLEPECAACGRLLARAGLGPVCLDCLAACRPPSPPLCNSCGWSLPSWRPDPISHQCPLCQGTLGISLARTGGPYEGPLKRLLQAFKYERRRGLAPPLASIMRRAGELVLRDADVVVPVPLHAWRRLHRGFNQAAELARHLGPPVLQALWRRRPTAPQAPLGRRARARNVEGAFGVAPWLGRRTRRRWLEGRTVVVVDDVITTGATLRACAAVLLATGAREVRLLTLARATLGRTTQDNLVPRRGPNTPT